MIKCSQQKCFVIKIVDFQNIPITDLIHPETGEEVGDIAIEVYDYKSELFGTYTYAKGSPELVICNVPAGWLSLKFKAKKCKRPKAYPQEEGWNQIMLAADIIAHKAIKAAAEKKERPSQQRLPKEEYKDWNYRRVSHGALYLPEQQKEIAGKMVLARSEQPCNIRYVLDGKELCGKCGLNKWTKYLIELAPLLCWIPALRESELGAFDDWDSISANNLSALATLAYAQPDESKNSGYAGTILETFDNLRTQRSRPYSAGGEWLDMILHEMPYDWHFYKEEFYGMGYAEKNPTDSQAFAATNLDTIIVAVRGTSSGKDAFVDIHSIPMVNFKIGASPGEIHRSFNDSFEFLWTKIKDYCVNNKDGINGIPKRIFVTGHSLGGAVASLIACALKDTLPENPLTLYTYGSPRVGNKDFAKYWNKKVPHLRHVNKKDPITALAPMNYVNCYGFYHFGHLRHLDFLLPQADANNDVSDTNVSSDNSTPWICDYGRDQSQELRYTNEYKDDGDNAPWGPYELDKWDALTVVVLHALTRGKAKFIAAYPLAIVGLNAAAYHFMSWYRAHLQNELRQRYEYAKLGAPLLSKEFDPSLLNTKDEYQRELSKYSRIIILDEILLKHVAELHPKDVVEEELKRFCQDTQRLDVMAKEEQELSKQAEEEKTASEKEKARRGIDDNLNERVEKEKMEKEEQRLSEQRKAEEAAIEGEKARRGIDDNLNERVEKEKMEKEEQRLSEQRKAEEAAIEGEKARRGIDDNLNERVEKEKMEKEEQRLSEQRKAEEAAIEGEKARRGIDANLKKLLEEEKKAK